MKLFSIILLPFLVSCSAITNVPKAEKICTQEFRMISVQFKDGNGSAVAVTDFQAINKRTNKPLVQPENEGRPGYYTVASDADLNTLSPKGDTIGVSARNPQTNQTVTASYVISGGADACHIEKLSGPEIIMFK